MGKKTPKKIQQLHVENKENTEEIQHPVQDEENTPEMAIHLGRPPPASLDFREGWGGGFLGQMEEVQAETPKLRNCDRNKLEG